MYGDVCCVGILHPLQQTSLSVNRTVSTPLEVRSFYPVRISPLHCRDRPIFWFCLKLRGLMCDRHLEDGHLRDGHHGVMRNPTGKTRNCIVFNVLRSVRNM